jgi:4-hydroxybenzoate polyprenyltransferase
MLRTIRPHQWVKNVFVLAPAVFAKELFDPQLVTSAGSAFLVFCLLAGAVYTINDLADVEADRQHPLKRYRPIASGRVPVKVARVQAALLVVGSLAWGLAIDVGFAIVAAVYLLQNLLYSLRFKHVAYLDVAFISAGFVLRVVGGGFAAEIAVSNYLVACTALLALFLGFGKRRHELAVAARRARQQRAALEGYTRRGLEVALAITSILTVSTYIAYTLDAHTRQFFKSDWLWVSTIFVALGVSRFLTLVRTRPKAESPTQEMLRDGPFVAIVLCWVGLVMWVVYNLRPG